MDGKITIVDTEHAWGYHCPEDFGVMGEDESFRKFVYLHDACNIASIIVSPLVGLIRAVAAIFFLHQISNMDQTKTRLDLDAAKRFMYMQLGRAVLELFCLGIILGTVVDAIATLKHKKMLCFENSKKASEV